LIAQTGHRPAQWPFVILKELVDNALDACEEAGIVPEITVTVDKTGITLADNGPDLDCGDRSSVEQVEAVRPHLASLVHDCAS
jgi:hypothetical protein